MKPRFDFDERYYARYYENPKTRVSDADEALRLGKFLAGYLGYLQAPVRSVLDLGCGTGHMKAVTEQLFPGSSYTGVERSEYLCKRFGWKQSSVVDFRSRRRFDLVICRGVLQYLTRSEAEAAIENFGRLCRGTLYLEALTREDWEDACDKSRTDGDVYLRPVSFYRKRLGAHFTNCGGGVFAHEDSTSVLYALEKL